VGRLSELLAEHMGPAVRLACLWNPHALRCHQQLPQGELQSQLLLEALWSVWERRQECQPCVEGCNRFMMRIAPRRPLRRVLPIVHVGLDFPTTFEVDGKPGRDLCGLCTIARLQPGANAPVEFPPPSAP
jgi:hypothetical protein